MDDSIISSLWMNDVDVFLNVNRNQVIKFNCEFAHHKFLDLDSTSKVTRWKKVFID
jgi:hypothetical protein